MKILFTGGNGNFANEIKKLPTQHEFLFTSKEMLSLHYPDFRIQIDSFCNNNTYFDVVVGAANKYQGLDIANDKFDTDGINIALGHSYLIEKLKNKPKYYINFTTSLNYVDSHYYYRSTKTFIEDYFYRFFTHRYPQIKFFNIQPGHISDENNRKVSSKLFMQFLDNIENYKSINYDFCTNEPIRITDEFKNKTLKWE